MVDVLIFGFVESIRCNDNFVVVKVSVRRAGYKKKDGTVVGEEILVYRIMFASYMRRYISEHFDAGILVKIKGTMLPYAKDGKGDIVDGYTILGQTMERGTYPLQSSRISKKVLKDSVGHEVGNPDLDGFLSDDF